MRINLHYAIVFVRFVGPVFVAERKTELAGKCDAPRCLGGASIQTSLLTFYFLAKFDQVAEKNILPIEKCHKSPGNWLG